MVLFTSCKALQPTVRLYSNSLDYANYQKKGFFITEAPSVSFAYSPVSSVSSTLYSGYIKVDKKGNKPTFTPTRNQDDVYGGGSEASLWGKTQFVAATREVVLEELYRKATESGADGIINLKITYFSYAAAKGYNDEGYAASGMAIKIK